jgi:hypothetical protein
MEIGKRWRFGNLTNSIQDAINSSITTLKTKFENNDPPTAVTQYTRLWWNYRFAARSAENTQAPNPCASCSCKTLFAIPWNIKKIFLILFSTLSYLQNNSDFDVFKK